MRILVIAALFVLVITACNGGEDRPESSAHPELSVDEILDRIPEDDHGPQTARITTVEESDGVTGGNRDVKHSFLVGDDLYADSESDDLQLLIYKGEYYTRESSSDPWEAADPAFQDFLGQYERVRDSLLRGLDPQPPDDTGMRRLADEYIDGHQVVHLALDISFSGSDVEAYNQHVLDAVASFGHDTTDLPRVARMEGTYEIWLDSESFEYRGYGVMTKAWASDGELLLSSKERTTISDINEPLELPGPLPTSGE